MINYKIKKIDLNFLFYYLFNIMDLIKKPKLVCKFIGYQNNNECDFIIDQNDSGISNLKYIYLKFMQKGMNIQDLKQIKFISTGSQIKNLETNLIDSTEENKIIFIFINDIRIKYELINKIFTNILNLNQKDSNLPQKYENNNDNFNKTKHSTTVSKNLNNLPLEDDEEELYNPSNGEIQEINNKIIDNFKNKDFVNLLRICINKPDLLKMVNAYLVNGDTTENLDDLIINYKKFKYIDEYNYIIEFLSNDLLIQINADLEEKIKNILDYNNGHLNLTLRYILSKYLEETTID